MKTIFLLLGLPQNASEQALRDAFSIQSEQLASQQFEKGSKSAKQAAAAQAVLKKCFDETFQNGFAPKEDTYFAENADAQVHPRLGQLCVASGIISMDQLQEAVDAQLEQNLALGEILQLKQFISQAELDGLLLGQGLIDMPSACNDDFGKRLVLLGLATEEMILIAQMEQQAVGGTISEIVERHRWVDPSILKALNATKARK